MRRVIFIAIIILASVSCSKKEVSLKVMGTNIWNDGKMFEGSFQATVDMLDQSDADVILLQEVRSQSIVDTLASILKGRGKEYCGVNRSISTAIMSKYPITDIYSSTELGDDSYAFIKATITIEDQEVSLFSVHLDWLYEGYYLARGYDGVTWDKLLAPVVDADSLITYGLHSRRKAEIAALIKRVEQERALGRIVIFAGDFNEPSHLDWGEDTKDIRDHGGMVVEWQSSSALHKAGYKDAYREHYPNVVTHPGFTCNAGNRGAKSSDLEWALGVDDRERIDRLYFVPDERLELKEIAIFGPKEEYWDGRIQYTKTEDNIVEPTSGAWHSDHKATLATFIIKTK